MDQVVEVLHHNKGRWHVGSGFVVREGIVLTAAHVVGEGTVLVRFRGNDEHPARLCRLPSGRPALDESADLAVVGLDEGRRVTAVTFAVLRGDPTLRGPNLRDCVAFGFPAFAEKVRPQHDKRLREMVRVDGYVPMGEGIVEGLATLRVPDAPRDAPIPEGHLAKSSWQGISGAVVFADGHAIGVISEHHRPAGVNGLTVVPLTRLDFVKESTSWWELLGVANRAELPQLPAFVRSEVRLQNAEATVDTSTLHKGSTLPEGPRRIETPRYEFYAVPPYVGGVSFTGRVSYLDKLDNWARSSDPVLVIESIGGMGKSALAWEWAAHHASMIGLRGRFWWSFYEGTASMADFMVEALAYLTARQPGDVRKLDRADLARQFHAVLCTEPHLLVLDGFERLLAAYHQIDASKLHDDDLDLDRRSVVDDFGLAIMRSLTKVTSSKVLLTTRLTPNDLENEFSSFLPGVRRLQLAGLSDADCHAMLKKLGIHITLSECVRFFQTMGNHPLQVGFVAGLVAKYRNAPMHFARWLADPAAGGALNLARLPLKRRRAHILDAAFRDLHPDAAEVLKYLSVFTSSIEWETIRKVYSLAKGYEDGESPQSVERRLDWALTDLQDRCLIWWDRANNTYDLHPIVRAYAYDQLDDANRVRANEIVHQHFEALPPENIDSATTTKELSQTVAMFTALVGANRFGEACRLWSRRLSKPYLERIGANHEIIALLTPLRQTNDIDVIGDLATALDFLGHHEEAIELEYALLNQNLNSDDTDLIATSLAALAVCHRSSGNLVISHRYSLLKRKLETNLTRGATRPTWLGLAILAVIRGNSGEAERAFRMFGNARQISGYPWLEGDAFLWQKRHKLIAGSLTEGELVAPRGLLHGWVHHRMMARLQYELLMQNHEYERAIAAAKLEDEWSRRVGLGADRAREAAALALAGRFKDADTATEEALAWESRTRPNWYPYHATATALWLLGREVEALHHAKSAYRQAWMDGGEYSDRAAINLARELLAKMGESPPCLDTRTDLLTAMVPGEVEVLAYIERSEAPGTTHDEWLSLSRNDPPSLT
ncbi:S1 family peptidase [Amycolatopsis sp. NPDC003861]